MDEDLKSTRKYTFEKEISKEEIVGKKFEDLSEEEMQKIQGSGSEDIATEGIGDITTLLTSKAPYNCRN